MNSQDETWEKLDAEFDHYLVDMKPYVLKLSHKSDRQRCALWIKKLCEPSGAGSGITGRKNRNIYAKLLLHMLKRGVLEGPFTHRPDEGLLKTLPSYMSIYFDEPNTVRVQSRSPEGIPDWVMGELGAREPFADESWRRSLRGESAFTSSPIQAPRRQYTDSGKLPPRSQSLSSIHKSLEENISMGVFQKKNAASLEDSDIEARLNSWNLGIENPRYLREKPIPLSPISPKMSLGKINSMHDDQSLYRMHEKELEMKAKMMEAKFHEEKLQLQQKHDVEVQKILERKNCETEDLKTLYRSKQIESEETIRKLEKKVQTLVRESQVIRESKERQITELKKMCEQSTDSVKNEWEKKMHMAVADMEQEKLQLQQKHTENIQALLDDTNARLLKMEADYVAQNEETNQMVKELEARVQQLTVEAESSNVQRLKLLQEKTELEKAHRSICFELQNVKERHSSLQKEKDRVSQEYEQRIQQQQSKYDSSLSLLARDHALSAAKASEVIGELEQCVAQLKQRLQESEHQRQQQLREKENKFQQELLHQECLHESKVHAIQSELDQEKGNAQRRTHKLQEALKEKEEQLTRVAEVQRLQAQQAESALEEFKRQVELNSQKVYAEMKEQTAKVEADLNKSKSHREKQAKEFALQREEIMKQYEQQITELKLQHEQSKTHLLQQHNTQKNCLVQDHEREIERLKNQTAAAILEYENKMKDCRRQDLQRTSELQAQVHRLQEELAQVNEQRRQQLMELSQLRQEEKKKAAQEQVGTVSKMKCDMERAHASEMEKQNARFQQMENEYNKKLAESAQVIAGLQNTIDSLKEEGQRQETFFKEAMQKFEEEKNQLIRENECANRTAADLKTVNSAIREEMSEEMDAAEKRYQDAVKKFEEEKRQLTKDHEQAIKVLREAVQNSTNQARCAEMKLQHRELEAQEQVTHIRQQYERKVKGLMPMCLRKELEDTIASLKSQVGILQKRVCVIQDELDVYKGRRELSFGAPPHHRARGTKSSG